MQCVQARTRRKLHVYVLQAVVRVEMCGGGVAESTADDLGAENGGDGQDGGFVDGLFTH